MENKKRLIEIPEDGIIRIPIMAGEAMVGEKCIDLSHIPTVDAVILPCKIGDTVYRIYDDCDFPGDCGTKRMCNGCEYRNLFFEEQAFCLSMLKQDGSFNRPYYLTREEAEAALAKMDGDENRG